MCNRLWPGPAVVLAVAAYLAPHPVGWAPAAIAQQDFAAPATAGKWKVYHNERYAFRLSYPPDSQVHTGTDHGYQYTRLLNYEPEPGGSSTLQRGEYHVEVLIFDHRLGHRMKSPCRELVHDGHQVRAGKVNALRGLAEPAGDDGGATSFALCLQAGKVDVLVHATEQDPLGPLANRILDGVQFGN